MEQLESVILSFDKLLEQYNIQENVNYIEKKDAEEMYEEISEDMEEFDIEFSHSQAISNESASKEVLTS